MPYPTAILFIFALFTTGMALIGWWQEPSAASFGPWFVAKVTEGGLWTGLVLFLVAAVFLTWRDRRAR